jgi:hypothetical protein
MMLEFHELIQMVLETFANVLKFYYFDEECLDSMHQGKIKQSSNSQV